MHHAWLMEGVGSSTGWGAPLRPAHHTVGSLSDPVAMGLGAAAHLDHQVAFAVEGEVGSLGHCSSIRQHAVMEERDQARRLGKRLTPRELRGGQRVGGRVVGGVHGRRLLTG